MLCCLFSVFYSLKTVSRKGFHSQITIICKRHWNSWIELFINCTVCLQSFHVSWSINILLGIHMYTCNINLPLQNGYKSNLLLLCYANVDDANDAKIFCWILPLHHMAISLVFEFCSCTIHVCPPWLLTHVFMKNEVYLYGLTQLCPGGHLHLVFSWLDALRFLTSEDGLLLARATLVL